MEVQTASWPLLTASGDAGVTEQQDYPRYTSQSLDEQAEDILKLFGETADNSPNMNFEAFHFDDTLGAHFGEMTHNLPATHIDTNSGSEGSSSARDSNNMAHHTFGPWPTMTDPPTFGYEQTALQPGPAWAPEPRFDQQRPMTFTYHGGGEGLGIHMPPTSNPMGGPPTIHYDGGGFAGHHSSPIDARDDYGRQHFSNVGWQQQQLLLHIEHPPAEDIFGDEAEGEEGADSTDPCYAQLLHRCLKDAPHHTLSLRELYEWVSQHSQKAKDPNNRGWQNSVRHNLSMNAAFQRVPNHSSSSSSSKKGSLWCLTEEALRDGVISTTRYRKDPKRKPERRAIPAVNRQASGAKGGRATRDATRLRQRHHTLREQQRSPYSTPGVSPTSGFIPSTSSSNVHGYAPPPALINGNNDNHHPGVDFHGVDGAGSALPPTAPTTPYFLNHHHHQQEYTHPLHRGYHQATPEDFLLPATTMSKKQPGEVTNFGFLNLPSSASGGFGGLGDEGGLFGDRDFEIEGEGEGEGEGEVVDTPTLTEGSFDD